MFKIIFCNVSMYTYNERQSAVLYMLDTNKLIQCFIKLGYLVRHCTDCGVKCNGLQILRTVYGFLSFNYINNSSDN